MNSLARVVHDLATGRQAADLAGLSSAEEAAVQRMRPLLALSPGDLAAFLERQDPPEDWPAPARVVARRV